MNDRFIKFYTITTDLWLSSDRFMTDMWVIDLWQLNDSFLTDLWYFYVNDRFMIVLWHIYIWQFCENWCHSVILFFLERNVVLVLQYLCSNQVKIKMRMSAEAYSPLSALTCFMNPLPPPRARTYLMDGPLECPMLMTISTRKYIR